MSYGFNLQGIDIMYYDHIIICTTGLCFELVQLSNLWMHTHNYRLAIDRSIIMEIKSLRCTN